jgi:GR25 family glycosyltransferase involved in LPS biosynthesis
MLLLKAPRRARSTHAIIVFFLVLSGVWLYTYRQLISDYMRPEWHNGPETSSSNSTLGFGRIYVVSQQDSPRRETIIQAANVTELDLSIPDQPVWTQEDEDNFRLPKGSTIGTGSLYAWLGHLHALQQFLDSDAETALFLEDDVDWDIRLRTIQAPLVADAVRHLLRSPPLAHDAPKYPYGDPENWDLLYLGHCGDYFHGMDIGFKDGHVKPRDLARTPHVRFADPTMLHSKDLHPYTTSLLKNLGVGEYTRLVHRSVFPLCTFGYALSRAGAQRLLEMGSKEPNEKGHKAYDVLILLGCRDYGLRCWTVNPELFHHIPGPSIIDTEQGNKELPPVDQAGLGQIEDRLETPNIDCGFWGGAFSFDDEARLEWLREEVTRKGRCMKSGHHVRIAADDVFTE